MGFAIFLYLFGFIAIVACGGNSLVYMIFWGIMCPGIWYGIYKLVVGLDYKINKEYYNEINRKEKEKEINKNKIKELEAEYKALAEDLEKIENEYSNFERNHIYNNEIINSFNKSKEISRNYHKQIQNINNRQYNISNEIIKLRMRG